ncbi:MAG: flippase [Deltaproteobacteria bacterium HGW-Deltaproteobacteria-1]|jgi:PST family polysaccharide transporter|nr:MAG: flippase [Deltaproteobacteria bacterium HGW-Deltaproteobacteria-1]
MIEKILKFLPVKLRCKIEHRQGLTKILNNITWMFFDKFLRLGVGLFVGVWIARYLGPEQFGLLSYALAFVALFTAVANLGLNGIVVRDLVQDPSNAETTMGTSFVLSVLGGFGTFCLSLLAIGYARPDDELAKFIVVLLSLLMVFKATDVVRYWFESQVQSKYIIWMENGVFLAMSTIKICLILTSAPLIAFVWAIFVESLIVAVGLLGIYEWRGGKLTAWRFRFARAKILLKDSWPLILSGLAIMVYMRIDQLMLGQMLGNESVGIYSAAVRISEIWYFIPIAIVASVFPSIIEAKKQDETIYNQRLQKLYDMMVILALSLALLMTFLSDWVVTLLFGNAYQQSGPILAIHIWAGIFVFLGVASGKWFLIEGLQRYTFYRTLLGAVVNVGLNILMIPKFGATGAAYATVISYAIAAMFSDLLQKETRPMFKMKLRAFNILRIAISIQR